MGIYMLKAEMPHDCCECYHKHACERYWARLGTSELIPWDSRDDNCPLVEVKNPHGRLIDIEVLCERLLTAWDTADEEGKQIVSAVIADVVTPIVVGVPTVIESEKE